MRWMIYNFIMIINISRILADDHSNCSIQTNGLNTSRNRLNDHSIEDTDEHTPAKKSIQVIFTIPYSFSRESIVNETVFITDTINGQIIPSIIRVCTNGSSFFIDYSTSQPLPHNVCLFLLLNMTTLKEMLFCRMINRNSSSIDSRPLDDHRSGPGVIFIISQSVIILIMMFIIALGHKARQKRMISRVHQYFRRTKQDIETNFIPTPIEQLVIVATDRTSISPDRKYTSPTLIDIKEFTKRMSAATQGSEHEQF